MVQTTAVHEATTFVAHLVEAAPGAVKVSVLAPIERRTQRALARAFRKQRDLFLQGFERYRPWFDRPKILKEAAPPDWEPAFDDAALKTIQAFKEPLDQATQQALDLGILYAAARLGVRTSVSLKHPQATAYAGARSAARVTQINQTTRQYLRRIITQAVDKGWSYDRTAQAITQRYAQFAGPPLRVRPRHIRSRAHAIAVFEVGDAYEFGNMLVAQDLKDAGLAMEKSWLTVGDHRVRPEHRANQAQGWIPLDAVFVSGHERPPTDPGCRCTVLIRRRPSPTETSTGAEPETGGPP